MLLTCWKHMHDSTISLVCGYVYVCYGYQLWPCFRLYFGTVVAIYFGHGSDCILELLWLSTLAMFQTVCRNCCGYLLWSCYRLYFGTFVGYRLCPCYRLYFGTVVAIYFGHVTDCILELLWLSTLPMYQTVFWNCCWLSTLPILQTVFWNCFGCRLCPCYRLYFGTVVGIDFAHVSDCM